MASGNIKSLAESRGRSAQAIWSLSKRSQATSSRLLEHATRMAPIATHSSQFIPSYHVTFDTYGDISNCQAMINAMNSNIDNGDLVVITSWDAYGMNAALKQAISTKLGVPLDSMPEVNPGQRASFALAGIAGDRGIAFANLNEGSDVHAELLLSNARTAIRHTPVKDMLTKPGTTLTLQIQTDGLTADRLSGTAICKTARVTASLSNLIQGSFRFEGTGPLE